MHCRKDEKEMWLQDWIESGKNPKVYAKENGLNPQTFVNWTKSGIETKSCFVEVPTQMLQQKLKPEILIEKGDFKIHIPLLIGYSELKTVMEGLGIVL